jgi:hypothetical protein
MEYRNIYFIRHENSVLCYSLMAQRRPVTYLLLFLIDFLKWYTKHADRPQNYSLTTTEMQNHHKYDIKILNSDTFCRFSRKLFERFTKTFFKAEYSNCHDVYKVQMGQS